MPSNFARHAAVAAVFVFASSPAALAGANSATVDFEELTDGQQYGPGSAGMQTSGQFLFSDDGISVSVGDFYSPAQAIFNSPSAFVEVHNAAELDGFPTRALEHFGSIALEFDFTALAFSVTQVTLDWSTFGGSWTLGVNGEHKGIGSPADIPAMLGGAGVSVINQTFAPAMPGTITIVGAIDTITIGGQEFGLDNVTATPTPGAGALLAVAGLAALRRRRA